MTVIKPLGPRVLVEEMITTLSVEDRMAKAGLYAIVDEKNRPQPTQGRVIAIGTDPILRDAGIIEGCIVSFGKLAGTHVYVEDKQYRSLEFQELITIIIEE